MKRSLKLTDIAKDGDTQLIEIDIDKLIPLPPPYDKVEELPGFKQLTEDQRERLVCNLDGVVSTALPKPKNKEEEKKYVEQFVSGLKKLLSRENNWTFLQPLLLSIDYCAQCQTCCDACPIYLASGKNDLYRPTYRSEIFRRLVNKVSAKTEEIVEAVVVGNTAMHHLFLGLPVSQLALSPFVPAVSRAQEVKARYLGLGIAPGAYVHLLPNIAGFVGADHVAVLLATEAFLAEGPIVALDIGTNTEVSLVNKGKITATSCASGPAFEGGHIKYGMRAATGAIERLRITGDSIQYQTIDEAPPIGICGSGILDALAQLYLAGVIDDGGRIMRC
jgi:ferredoxin